MLHPPLPYHDKNHFQGGQLLDATLVSSSQKEVRIVEVKGANEVC